MMGYETNMEPSKRPFIVTHDLQKANELRLRVSLWIATQCQRPSQQPWNQAGFRLTSGPVIPPSGIPPKLYRPQLHLCFLLLERSGLQDGALLSNRH